MSVSPGTRIGSFEIVAQIGAGGMGEVYRARDTRLDRQVAVKVLPGAFANDADRLARFEREAKLLASLNHPHIAQIHGLEESGATRALVMELVEGPTLADRIAEGPLPLDEALAIARQMADALGAAHEQGIVHRDLKPANVKVRPDGTVKVLDFGLAKLSERGSSGGSDGTVALSLSPTITSPAMTQAGVILGTAAYMSPEQARGRAVDQRADIWAFGAVLYEMVTGQRPFKGDDLTETLASVVKEQPDLDKAPVQVRRLLARCLEKEPRRRLRDIADVWDLLDDASRTAAALPPLPAWRRVLPWAIAGAFGLAAVATGLLYFRAADAPPAGVVRFQLSAALQAGGLGVSLSPDGRHIAYQIGNRIWVRDFDAVSPRMLATSDAGIAAPFWTADSRFVVYDSGGKLTKIDASGGAPQTLTELSGILAGGFGTRDERIIFSTSPGGVHQVSSRGGVSSRLGNVGGVVILSAGSQLLPDGRRFVYASGAGRNAAASADSGIYVASLDASGGPVRVLSGDVRSVAYVPSHDASSGYLLFTRGPTLLAQRFDGASDAVSGEPVVVADRVGTFSASESGTLVHTEEGEGRRLVWVDRQGNQVGTAGSPGDYNELRLSPDGSKVAVVRAGGAATWVYDFARETSAKVSMVDASSIKPVWSPDGSRLVFTGNREGSFGLYSAPSDGAGGDASVLTSKDTKSKYPLSWSRDGRWLLYSVVDAVSKEDLWLLPMSGSGERKPEPFLATNYRETDAAFSPDGHFVAYVSDESGTPEVYVRAFPSSRAGKWLVSNGGGYQPRWRVDGKELLYLTGRSQLMSVDTTPAREFAAGRPKALFTATVFGGGASINNWYWDIAPDGQRMLFNRGSTETGTALLTVVLNWQAGLRPERVN